MEGARLVEEDILRMSEISFMINDYQDIFSSFDPRPYSERALSVDFLDEAKRASVDKEFGNIQLRLIVSKKKKSESIENIIKQRLHEHFKKHHEILHKEAGKVMKRGACFTIAGVFIMFLAAYILFKNHQTLLISFLIILLEPAGWFLFWEGLGQIVFESKKKKPELDFYHKMAKSKIEFIAY